MKKQQSVKKGRHEAPRRRLSYCRNPEATQRRNGFKWDLLSTVLIFFCIGVLYLASRGILTARNQQIAYYENQISGMQVANERLQLEIGYLGTLDKIEQQAEVSLAMNRPDAGQMLPLGLIVRNQQEEDTPETLGTYTASEVTAVQLAQGPLSGILNRWKL